MYSLLLQQSLFSSTWTLSETPNSNKGDNTLDITVKRVGLVTNWLHDYAQVGMQIKLKGVSREMAAVAFDEQTAKPIVPKHLLLLSAGIGITPNLAMVCGVGTFGLQNDTIITMILVERHEEDLISQSKLKRRAKSYPNLQYTRVYKSRRSIDTRWPRQTDVTRGCGTSGSIHLWTGCIHDRHDQKPCGFGNIRTKSFEF